MPVFNVRVIVDAIREEVTLSAPDQAAAEQIALNNAMMRSKEKAVVIATLDKPPDQIPADAVTTDFKPRP